MTGIRREKHSSDVGSVGFELCYGSERGDVLAGDEAPDVDCAVDGVADGGAEEAAVCGDCDGGDAFLRIGYELVRALVLAQVPDPHVAAAVAGDELALVGMDHDVVDRHAVGVVSLDQSGAGIPDLDRACASLALHAKSPVRRGKIEAYHLQNS